MPDDDDDSFTECENTYVRNLTQGHVSPTQALLQCVAEIKGVDGPLELTPLHSTIGDRVERFYADPPSPDASAEFTFTYEGLRITLKQDGNAILKRQET